MADDSPKLTPKQEAFCNAYIETSNASEAYRQSYDVSPDAKPNGIWVDACKLLSKPNVALRVAELREENAKRNAVTVDSLTRMLKEDRELARSTDDPAAAINAVVAIAKLHGLVIDKKNVTSDNRHHHSAEPVSPFAEHLAEMLGTGAEGQAKGSLPH